MVPRHGHFPLHFISAPLHLAKHRVLKVSLFTEHTGFKIGGQCLHGGPKSMHILFTIILKSD